MDYFRRAGDAPDARVAEAVHLVRDKRQPNGAWLLIGITRMSMKVGRGR